MTRNRPRKNPQPKYQPLKLVARFGKDVSASQLAVIFGVNRVTVQRWRNPRTTIDQWDADRYAIRLGKHPSEIWTDWFDIEVTD